ncbi:hypothetical protein [Granulicella sp. S190]|uniref:hypothetical protein n=1 Tax=Granulicella sp. S190 TaxID=1747226 RepID=UPI00131CD499|nr:hypothetical protein [Granulicella sp. S190]
MSYQEKLILGQFLPIVIGCAYYFGWVRVSDKPWSVVGNILLIVVLQIVYLIAVAIFSKVEKSDERDQLIEYKAFKVSYLTLMAVGGLWVWALMSEMYTVKQLTSPGLIIAVWFGIEALRTGTQLVLHRIDVTA